MLIPSSIFFINFTIINNNAATAQYDISPASFSLLKKLARIYPHNHEISMEKIISNNAYSKKQSQNILRDSSTSVNILNILATLKGKVKIHVHYKCIDELSFGENHSIHGFSWIYM